MMACIGPIGDVEGRFTQAMTGATTATTDADGRLILDGTGGAVVFIGLLDLTERGPDPIACSIGRSARRSDGCAPAMGRPVVRREESPSSAAQGGG